MDRERVIRALFATSTLPELVGSEVEMFDVLNRGLPFETLLAMEKQGIVSLSEFKAFISARTLARRKGESQRLSAKESDVVARLARMHHFAIEVFGNTDKARKWLRTPNRAIKDRIPFELLRTDYGARIVESLLGRIAHGIFF